LSGSGPHGRIVKAMSRRRSPGRAGRRLPRSKPLPHQPPLRPLQGPPTTWCCKLFAEGSYEGPHDGMRKTIAKRLSESKQTIPHFYVSVDCQLDALLKLRGELNKAAPRKDDKPAYKLSVNDMVIKALALALRDVPDANVSWTDERHGQAQAFRCRRGCGHSGRSDHADRPRGRGKAAVCHFQRDEGHRQARQGPQAEARGIPGRHHGRLQHGHDGRQGLHGSIINPPHATICRGAAWRKRPVVKDGALCHRHGDDRDAFDRPPGASTARWARSCNGLQGLHRKPDGDAFRVRDWSGFIWSLGIGVLSLLVGVVLVADPLAGAIPLTLLVAVLFLATGVAKTMFALALRPASGWVWVLASGLVSVVLGVMILAGLPATATTILGLLLGIELVSNGVLFLFVALGLRRLGS
jgi:hypothetical protein